MVGHDTGGSLDVLGLVPRLGPVLEALDGLPRSYGQVFLVGGVVRDLLLGREVVDVDVDLALDGPAIELASALAASLGGSSSAHEDFGTATVTFAGQTLDLATTRSELYERPGALPTVSPAPIEADLARRDFTINAMAVTLDAERRGQLIDPHGGESDLASGTLRVLHDESFVDDATRLLRAARYEARYGFRLDPTSEELARDSVGRAMLGTLSGPRIGSELRLVLCEEAGVRALERLRELGVISALHSHLDAGEEALELMRAGEALERELEAGAARWRLRLAVLTRLLDAEDRRAWLATLQLLGRDVEVVGDAASLAPALAERAVGAAPTELHAMLAQAPSEAVVLALAHAQPGSAADEALRRFLTKLRHVALEIDGSDLAALGLAESPRVGKVLEAVLALKLEGALGSREDELDAARRMIAGHDL